MTNKLFAGVLAAATIFSFAGSNIAAPSVATAATEAEMQAQITALLAQIAALQASMGSGSSSSCYTFTTDLTLGSNSEAVRALQVFLNNKGYVIATAGPGSKGNETTYFGGLTRAALAKYQAAVAISPAAGYFGPVTRAKVNADCTPTTGGGTGTGTGSTSGLQGGEASLTDFDLRSEDSTGREGESKVEAFTAEFDVEDGDVRVERFEFIASSTDTSLETDPWNYFDKVYVMDGDGKTLASMDVDSRDDWDEEDDDVFRLSITGLTYVVREDDMAEMTVAFDIASNIDTADQAQVFEFYVEDEGIRARDAAGIDQYTGDDTDEVDFTFGEELSGDLNIQSNSTDPDAAILVADEDEESDEYTVFVFDIENDEDVDSIITDLTIDATVSGAGGDVSDIVRRATLSVGGDEFDGDITASEIEFEDIDLEIGGDDEETFTLMVTLVRNASGTISFEIDSTDVEAEGADSGDDADVSGSAASEEHTIALNGIAVEAVSVESDTLGTNDTIGQFDITFEVTAIDDDVYIASTTAESGTPGIEYLIFGPNGYTATTTSGLTSSADLDNGFYIVDEGDTEEFTLTVTIDPTSTGVFYVGLDKIRFTDSATTTGRTTFEVDENSADYKAGPETIIGS